MRLVMNEDTQNRKEKLAERPPSDSDNESKRQADIAPEDRYSVDDLDPLSLPEPEIAGTDKRDADSSPDDFSWTTWAETNSVKQDSPKIEKSSESDAGASPHEATKPETVSAAAPEKQDSPKETFKRTPPESEESDNLRTRSIPDDHPLSDDRPSPKIDSDGLDELNIGQTSDDRYHGKESIDFTRLSDPRIDGEEMSVESAKGMKKTKRQRKGMEKLAIVGGKMTGKSYLFHAMVHRLSGTEGSIGYFLNAGMSQLHELTRNGEIRQTKPTDEFLAPYRQWQRLEFTQYEPIWYQLDVPFYAGIFGRNEPRVEINYLEASGEGFFERAMQTQYQEDWNAFFDVRSIVFCLPIWAAFPGRKMTQEDWNTREELLQGLDRVANHFSTLLKTHYHKRKVKTILALTMADDRRSSLSTLRENWIEPYMQDEHKLLRLMNNSRGIVQYLANTRRVSDVVRKEMEKSSDIRIRSLPKTIKFGHAKTWFIPMTAIYGDTLDRMEQREKKVRVGIRAPVPVHVELPLLVAMSDGRQALM
uniref:Uncharacterized protein n=1 Tax=Candidatus Kentrum sp. LPFa TaxID=2126335 RepID=A0A450VZV5_9GAMM|nr:MAG: hypothetical protein BECKLPF1236B_GA0070989_10134 [Candidatus Kentron sp. LPFa]